MQHFSGSVDSLWFKSCSGSTFFLKIPINTESHIQKNKQLIKKKTKKQLLRLLTFSHTFTWTHRKSPLLQWMTDAPKVSAPSRPIHRVSPPPVHHRRITAAPLKWELQPPPPTSCFKATLMPQGHKRLTHTYDAFKSLSHTSPVREVGLTFKPHSLAALVIPSLWFQVISGLLWTQASPQLEMAALYLPI